MTINAAVTFKPAFAAPRTKFMLAADSVDQSSGWQAKGTWTVPGGNPAPTAVSVTPAAGSGSSQTFSYVFADGSGFADITTAQLLINGSLTGANGCFMYVDPSSKLLWLLNDGATQWMAPITLGGVGTQQNSQCSVAGGGSAVSGAGSTLTINVADWSRGPRYGTSVCSCQLLHTRQHGTRSQSWPAEPEGLPPGSAVSQRG